MTRCHVVLFFSFFVRPITTNTCKSHVVKHAPPCWSLRDKKTGRAWPAVKHVKLGASAGSPILACCTVRGLECRTKRYSFLKESTVEPPPHQKQPHQAHSVKTAAIRVSHDTLTLSATPTSTRKAAKPQTATPPSTNEPHDELEPWVVYTVRAKHKADDLLAASGITLWILRQSQTYWRQARMIAKTPRRQLDQTCLQLESSDINQTEEGTGNKEDRPRDGNTTSNTNLQPDTSNRDHNDLTSD